MPNWVTVRVKAGNPQIFSEKFLSSFTQEEIEKEDNIADNGEILSKYVDFNILIPTSPDLEIVKGVCYQNEEKFYEFQRDKVELQEELITPLLQKLYKEGLTQDKFVKSSISECMKSKDNFIKVYNLCPMASEDRIKEDISNVLRSFYNYKVYGETDWYEFHINKWGTKWNAITLYVNEEEGFVEFQTAWSCPFEILEELAKYTDIAVSYADEDIGSNFGAYTITNGIREDLIESQPYNKLNGMQKVDAIATATAITQGEVYDLNEEVFGSYEDEEFSKYFSMSKNKVLKIAQESVKETQDILSRLELV